MKLEGMERWGKVWEKLEEGVRDEYDANTFCACTKFSKN